MIPLPANAHRFIGLISIENCGAPSFPEPSPYFSLPLFVGCLRNACQTGYRQPHPLLVLKPLAQELDLVAHSPAFGSWRLQCDAPPFHRAASDKTAQHRRLP